MVQRGQMLAAGGLTFREFATRASVTLAEIQAAVLEYLRERTDEDDEGF